MIIAAVVSGIVCLAVIMLECALLAFAVSELARTNIRQADALLVFCHFLEQDGDLSDEFRVRLDKAVELWKVNSNLHNIIVNGGQTRGTPTSQGSAAAKYLITKGVPARAIVWSSEGHDTLDEVRLARNALVEKRIEVLGVISNKIQLYQAAIAFSRLSVRCVFVQTPRQVKSPLYVFMRFALLIPTNFDPLGTGWLFSFIRRGRQ